MNQEILGQIQANPELQNAVASAVQTVAADPDTNSESLQQMQRMLEFVLQNPDSYPEFLQTAAQSGVLESGELPEQFDELALTIMLIVVQLVLQMVQQGAPGFARGGLNDLARRGRRGDDRLAHINPFEDRLLRAYGGSGSINPRTGMPEYGWLDKTFKSVVKAVAPVLPIALAVFAPGIGTALGGMLGASGIGAGILGNALIGGATSALGGGNALQGALLGGLTGGLGQVAGGAANSALGLGLGQAGQSVLGGGLMGALGGAVTGQGAARGALQGAGGAYLGQAVGGTGGAATQAGGRTFGNMLAAGYKPKEAVTGGALAGLATGMMGPGEANSGRGLKAPSDVAIEGLRSGPAYSGVPEMGYGTSNYLTGEAGFTGPQGGFTADYGLGDPRAPVAPGGFGAQDIGSGLSPEGLTANVAGNVGAAAAPSGFGMNMGTVGKGLLLASALQKAPEPVQQAVSTLSPEQQEYFNRPSIVWDWDRMMQDANARGQSLAEYMSGNWNNISTEYGQPKVAMARGGALSRIAYLASGGGTGRSDSIDAKLSDGEYVMDAETVALLGDGSANAGARKLDTMRAKIRQHKGKSMAGGKFSANAKSPLTYLKEAR